MKTILVSLLATSAVLAATTPYPEKGHIDSHVLDVRGLSDLIPLAEWVETSNLYAEDQERV